MSPRPRLTSDAAILAATARVIARRGPSRFTLADVGREAGVAPATLVQRFGSKRQLLLAMVAGADESVTACFAEARRNTSSPLDALLRAMEASAQMAPTPEELSNHLAFLQMDLSDPEFHQHALVHGRANRNAIRTLLDEAVAVGELQRCDTAKLTRAVDAVVGGALIGWAIHRSHTAKAAIREALQTLLDPYRL
jgi:AcrR family transcriptional regulator